MYKLMRNNNLTFTGCPVLRDDSVRSYLKEGQLPTGVDYLEVPPGKVVRQRGFWLVPVMRVHPAATMFLVSTDVYAMNVDEHEKERLQLLCYYSDTAQTHYIGRAIEGHLCSVPSGEFPDLPLTGLSYVGRVIASQ